MKRLTRQDGLGLIPLLGLMAALAIAAAGLVMLLSNSMAATYSDQTRTKAFNVAEGALNVGMATLKSNWKTPSPFPTATFRDEYPTATFPNPASGPNDFISVQFFDNTSTSGGTISPTTSPPNDVGGPGKPTTPDNMMYIRATARVGNGVATVQGLVQRTFWNPSLPRGLAMYSGATISSNGMNWPKVDVLTPPPITPENPNGLASVYAGGLDVNGNKDPNLIVDSNKETVTIPPEFVPPIDSIISPTIIAGLKATANQAGRYFTDLNGQKAVYRAEHSLQSSMGGPGLQGLTVIDPSPGTTGNISLPGNTRETPAVLFVLGDSTTSVGFELGGGSDSYGYFYSRWGGFDFAHGNPNVYGTVVGAGNVGFFGTPRTYYDDNVWINITGQWTLNVRLVPNTWRELSPGATN